MSGECQPDCGRDHSTCTRARWLDEPVEGIDYGVVTAADVAMVEHAMAIGADETDYSEFYIDDDAP